MPLRALINEKEELAPLVSDADWETWKRQPNKKVTLLCCDTSGHLRTSKLGTKHFVHEHKAGCDWKPETPQHLLAKTEIVRACKRVGYDAKTEVSGSDWRADVLASKLGKQGLIQIAFEVQWSPQTLQITQERQAKYERDEIRGCWFFRKPPKSEPTKSLPMFNLALEPDNSLVVHMNDRKTPLSKFIEDLLSRRIRFCDCYRLKPTQYIRINFFPVTCWKCMKNHHIYWLEEHLALSYCGKQLYTPDLEIRFRSDLEKYLRPDLEEALRPEVIAAAKSFCKTDKAKNITMGEIKPRYSRTLGKYYQSFGCPWCDDPIFANQYNFEEYCIVYYDDNIPKITWEYYHNDTQANVTDLRVLDYAEHWCYPETGEFCT